MGRGVLETKRWENGVSSGLTAHYLKKCTDVNKINKNKQDSKVQYFLQSRSNL